MKSTICHDFPSPDLLEGPKDGKIKQNAKFFSFQRLQTRSPPSRVRFCSLFNEPPSPPQRTYFLNDPLVLGKVLVKYCPY